MLALIITSEEKFAQEIALALKSQSHQVQQASSGEEARSLTEARTFDIILLDLDLRDMTGIELLQSLRSRDIETPVLALAESVDRDPRRLMAFEAGADDFMTRPLNMRELLARVRVIIRRCGVQGSAVIQIGSMLIDTRTLTISTNEVHTQLTSGEFKVFEILWRNRGTIVDRETFITHLHDSAEDIRAASVNALVCRLRRKIRYAGQSDLIRTVRDSGYVLHMPAG